MIVELVIYQVKKSQFLHGLVEALPWLAPRPCVTLSVSLRLNRSKFHMDQSFVYHLKLVISRLPSQIPWWVQPCVTFSCIVSCMPERSPLLQMLKTLKQAGHTCQTLLAWNLRCQTELQIPIWHGQKTTVFFYGFWFIARLVGGS